MYSPAYTPPSVPKACPWKLRGVVRGVLCFLIASLIACVPFSAVSLFSIDTPTLLQKPDWDGTNGNTAYADTIDQYNSFLDEMAEQAGLTPAQYIATVTGVSNIVSGVNFVRDGGVMGAVNDAAATTANNLNALIDAADYPAWSSLDASTQQSYGSQDAYNAAKFNSLMEAFGLDTARSRYYASGGGNFEWQNDEIEKLEQLGRIGSNWANGAANTFSSLRGTVTNNNYFVPWTGAAQHTTYDGSSWGNWPSGVPGTMNVARINLGWVYNSSNNFGIYQATTRDVYMVAWNSMSDSTNGSMYLWCFDWQDNGLFQKAASLAIGTNPPDISGASFYNVTDYDTITWTQSDKKDKSYYFSSYAYGIPANMFPTVANSGNVTGNNVTDRENQMKRAIYYFMAFGTGGDWENDAPKVDDYPEQQPSGDTNIYFPVGGIAVNTGWPSYTTSPSTPRPENDWNPNNETQTPEWENDTAINLDELQGIEFDKLFPFSLLYDVKALYEKVESQFVDDGETYNYIDIPMDYGADSETMELDLTWLHDLALIVRPFFQILLGASLLFFTIWLWRNILTG